MHIKPIKFSNKLEKSLYDYMAKLATEGRTVSYKEMGEHFGLPYEHNLLGKLLGPISEATYNVYGVLLSAVVVVSDTGLPGIGLVNLAWELDHPDVHDTEFLKDEIQRVFDYYKGKTP